MSSLSFLPKPLVFFERVFPFLHVFLIPFAGFAPVSTDGSLLLKISLNLNLQSLSSMERIAPASRVFHYPWTGLLL